MWKSKLLILILIGAFALAVGFSAVADLYAQDQAPGVIRTPGEMQKPPNEGINSGWVVAYGVLLKRPYFVEFRDDTVRINEIPWFPRRSAGGPTGETISPKLALLRSLSKVYGDYYLSAGRIAAEEKVTLQFGNSPLIAKMEFEPKSGDLFLTWSDGQIETVYLHVEILERRGLLPSQDEIRRDAVATAKADLISGSMITIGTKYGKTLRPESADEIIQLIGDLKKAMLSMGKARAELAKYVNAQFADDVVNNVDRW